MNTREQGFLLLTGYLGDPSQKLLTVAQLRDLTARAQRMDHPGISRELSCQDLIAMGCSRPFAQRVLHLLSRTEQLQWYLEKGKNAGCVPITRVSEAYPPRLRKCLHMEAPGVLWCRGDLSLLETPAIALVGSRELQADNHHFAREVGKQAALQGYTLVSGDARGADRAAQDSCLAHGGKVISVVADQLEKHMPQERILYISEEGFDLTFSAHRALQRNRVIHSLGSCTFVAQCRLGKGGTWNGTCRNLRFGWSPVYGFQDQTPAMQELQQMGAELIEIDGLLDIGSLKPRTMNFIDQ